MTTFVDTSALLAVLDAGDLSHRQAATVWRRLIESEEDLVSTSYVLVETFALTQSRLGLEAARTLDEDLAPMLEIVWLDETVHRAAVTAVLMASRRHLSLVDCASFETMRRRKIGRAFTLDKHFREQGFETLPDLSRGEATPS